MQRPLSSQIRVSFFLCLTSAMLTSAATAASRSDDSTALSGVTEAKAVFDIRQSDPNKLLKLLKLVGKTADSLVEQGAKPDFVLAFRGPASAYVSSDRRLIPLKEYEVADQIAAQVRELSARSGVRLEQCAVAAAAQKIDKSTIIPEVHVVGNTWISLMAYQNKGYAYIPID